MLIHAHQSSLSSVCDGLRYGTVPLHDSFCSAALFSTAESSLCSGTSRLVSSASNTPFNLRWHAVQRRLRELVQFRSSDCFSCPPPPCPRRPSPDTASTFALAQGQQEGDKQRAQALAQVPDAAPTPVNHTSRTRQSLHRGLPLRFYFGTHCRSLLIFSHYRNTGGCRLHWPLSLGNP